MDLGCSDCVATCTTETSRASFWLTRSGHKDAFMTVERLVITGEDGDIGEGGREGGGQRERGRSEDNGA